MTDKFPLGINSSDGIAWGAGSTWVKTRQGGNAMITRYDAGGKVLDTLMREYSLARFIVPGKTPGTRDSLLPP